MLDGRILFLKFIIYDQRLKAILVGESLDTTPLETKWETTKRNPLILAVFSNDTLDAFFKASFLFASLIDQSI
jgi:hypothetical protein